MKGASLAPLVAGTILCATLSACALPELARREPAYWDAPRLPQLFHLAFETAQKSRIAMAIRYDKGYVRFVEQAVEALRQKQENPAQRDDMSLLFALDELAEIYTYRLVHFQKARVANIAAHDLLRRIEDSEALHRVGWFFSHHRHFYYSVMGPYLYQSDLVGRLTDWPANRATDLNWAVGEEQTKAVQSIYPNVFLHMVINEDLRRLARRITARTRLLDEATGLIEPRPEEQLPEWPADDRRPGLEVRVLQSAMQSIPEPGRSLALLEWLWARREEPPTAAWLEGTVTLADRVLAYARTSDSQIGSSEEVIARYRRGISMLWMGRRREGLQTLEQMLAALEQHDKIMNERYERARSALRKTSAIYGALGVLLLPTVFLRSAAPLELIGTAVWRAVEGHDALHSQFGGGRHGLTGFLSENERIEFHFELGRAYEAEGHAVRAVEQYKQAIEITSALQILEAHAAGANASR